MAIDPKELRAGSYVLCMGHVRQIDHLIKGAVHFTDGDGATFRTLDPIPLTPEVLAACGFDQMPTGYAAGGTFWSIQVGNTTYLCSEPDATDFRVTPETWNGHGPDLWSNILHLNQLQNLYFALTGEELTYTPPTEKPANG